MKSFPKYLFSLLLGATIFSACDVIDGPKVDPNGFTGSTNKVLIEDFTGHMCGSCPRAHEKATSLDSTYGDNLIVIAIHTGSFATVVPFSGYVTEFKTPMGNELGTYYNADIEGLPIGLINRREWSGSPITRYSNWGALCSAVLADQPKMKMELSSVYDPSDRSINLNTKLEYFITGDANHNIVAVITEDSIIAKQEDYTFGHDDNYVHNHVLRSSITTGTWGDPVKGNQIFVGEKFDLNFTSTLDTAFDASHCSIVVYVHDNVSKEVLQVDKIKLTD
jgi:hypothetical protein